MLAILHEARDQGIAEGEAKGKAKAFREFLNDIFAYLFEVEPDHFDEEWQYLDLNALEHLKKIVFEIKSLAELEALLISLRPASPDEQEDD